MQIKTCDTNVERKGRKKKFGYKQTDVARHSNSIMVKTKTAALEAFERTFL